MLHNYGGVSGLFGQAAVVASVPKIVRSNFTNMVGVGATPEGLGNSYVAYELLTENFIEGNRAITKNLTRWFQVC